MTLERATTYTYLDVLSITKPALCVNPILSWWQSKGSKIHLIHGYFLTVMNVEHEWVEVNSLFLCHLSCLVKQVHQHGLTRTWRRKTKHNHLQSFQLPLEEEPTISEHTNRAMHVDSFDLILRFSFGAKDLYWRDITKNVKGFALCGPFPFRTFCEWRETTSATWFSAWILMSQWKTDVNL